MKKAYVSNNYKEPKKETNLDLDFFNAGGQNPNNSPGSTTETGGRGIQVPGTMSTEPGLINHDPEEYDTNPLDLHSSEGDLTDEDIYDMLINLGDNMDECNDYEMASFADFLIQKFASSDEDPELLFKSLILKIVSADIADTNDLIKKLTMIFSRTTNIEYDKTKDLVFAKKSAYKKMLHRAQQYLSE